jgi:hypothetical protein
VPPGRREAAIFVIGGLTGVMVDPNRRFIEERRKVG